MCRLVRLSHSVLHLAEQQYADAQLRNIDILILLCCSPHRAGAQEALLSLLDLPGVTQRFGSALASTLQLLARCPELELRVEFAN